MLKTGRVVLRAVETSDVDYLFRTENNIEHWGTSDTKIPFSKETMKKYASSVHDINEQGQFRFIIEAIDSGVVIGMLDIFDYEVFHQKAAIGIIITSNSHRNMGFAKESLNGFLDYAKEVLCLKQIHCEVAANNYPSVKLFESANFQKVGLLKYWRKVNPTQWVDVIKYQYIIE